MHKIIAVYLMFPVIYFKDGTNISVQASERNYSSPRKYAPAYEEVEVSASSKIEAFGTPEGESEPPIYGYVPLKKVAEYVESKEIDFEKTFNGYAEFRFNELQLGES